MLCSLFLFIYFLSLFLFLGVIASFTCKTILCFTNLLHVPFCNGVRLEKIQRDFQSLKGGV